MPCRCLGALLHTALRKAGKNMFLQARCMSRLSLCFVPQNRQWVSLLRMLTWV